MVNTGRLAGAWGGLTTKIHDIANIEKCHLIFAWQADKWTTPKRRIRNYQTGINFGWNICLLIRRMIRTRFGKTVRHMGRKHVSHTKCNRISPAKYDSELYKTKDNWKYVWAAKRLAGYSNAILSLRSYFRLIRMPCPNPDFFLMSAEPSKC